MARLIRAGSGFAHIPRAARRAARGAATVVAALAAWCAPHAALAQEPQTEVLVLYSTRRDAQISIVGDRELPRILERGLAGGVDFYTEYLDLARAPDENYLTGFRDFLEVKYRGVRFDVVIAMHATALSFVDRFGDRLFPQTPVVFLLDDLPPPALAGKRWTGILAPPTFAGTLDLAAALQPELQEVFIVTGAGSIDKEYESRVRRELRPYESRFRITYLAGLPMADLQAKVAALPPRSMVFFVMFYRDGANANFQPLEALDAIARSSNAPIYSWVDSTMDRGVVGGYLKEQVLQTEAVGQLALRVLNGEAADQIPVAPPNLNRNQVDWRQLQRWNISESRIPAGTAIRFRTPGVWERYRVFILAALAVGLAQTALIVGLLLQRARRQQAEEQVLGSQTALRRSYDRIRDLGRRLLGAQEEERARIARELHDDISQQMALLEIDLELLRNGDGSPHEGLLSEAVERTRNIAKSVHDLSHRLHPAKLRLIGLVSALDGLRRELPPSTFDVSFSHEAVPAAVPHDVTLCLFRTAQEALQNAIKHSGARAVDMRLAGNGDGITLTIDDDGVGFDVDGTWGKGLGLISMCERVESLGGVFAIRSTPHAGTRVMAQIRLDRGV